MHYRFLVGSYTNDIATLEFDPAPGAGKPPLAVSSVLTVGHHPSWITQHPAHPSTLFTGLEKPDGRLLTLRYDLETGKGAVVGDVHSGGEDPCTILATEREVFVGNFSSGTVGVFKQASSGASPEVQASQLPLEFTGTGPNPDRQDRSHPHQVVLHETAGGEEILVPDLGADKVWRLAKNAQGVWATAGEIAFDTHPGGGPRHIVVHEGILYTALELTCALTAHALHTEPPTLLAACPTLPDPPASPPPIPMLAAELLLARASASFPAAHLYVSNRNDPRARGDSIAVLAAYTRAAPSVRVVRVVHTGLRHLRGMLLFGPEDRYLIAGGQNGGGVKVYERTDGGRDLREIAHLPAEGEEGGLRPTAFVSI